MLGKSESTCPTDAKHNLLITKKVRSRDERIIQVPGCVVERELLVTFRLLLLSRSAPRLGATEMGDVLPRLELICGKMSDFVNTD